MDNMCVSIDAIMTINCNVCEAVDNLDQEHRSHPALEQSLENIDDTQSILLKLNPY